MTRTHRPRGRYLVAAAAALAGMLALLAVALPAAAAAPTTTQSSAQTGTTSINLTTGWNLVGWVGQTMDVSDALAGTGGGNDVTADVDVIWGFDSTTQTWSAYFPSAASVPGANDLTQLTHLAGYFVHANTAVTWNVS